jgi:peptidoglycan/LPS O-acetylase OafA/YrhL
VQDIAKSSHTRFDTLDGMRGIAAISVLLCHYAANAHVTTNAYLANDVFFILSGFVIAHSYGTRVKDGSMGAIEYMAKRLIRLYPMYLVGIILGLPALYLFGNPPDFIWKSFFINALYLPYLGSFNFTLFSDPTPVIGFPFPADPPAWSLFFEIVASAAFLVLARLSRKGLIATVIACYVLFIVAGLYLAREYHVIGILAGGWDSATFLGGFPRVIFGFAMGMLLYEWLHDGQFESVRVKIRSVIKTPWLLYGLLFLIFAFPKEIYGYY